MSANPTGAASESPVNGSPLDWTGVVGDDDEPLWAVEPFTPDPVLSGGWWMYCACAAETGFAAAAPEKTPAAPTVQTATINTKTV